MRKWIGFYLLLTGLLPCYGQYTVTEVVGMVKNKLSGETLQTGSKFIQPKDLDFSTPRCRVRAIVTGRGVVVLKPIAGPAASPNSSNMVEEIVKYMFNLRSSDGNLSGRGVNEEMIPEALAVDTQLNNRNLFCRINKYRFDPVIYQVSNGDQFFLQFDYPGDTPIVVPLQTINDTLLIYSSNFLTKKHGKIEDKARYELGFYSKQSDRGEPLMEIKPYLSSATEMELVIKSMISDSGVKDAGLLQQACYREVYQAQGKPSMALFKSSFGKLFNGTTK